MSSSISEDAERGIAFYSRNTLSWYDAVLFNVFNPFVWRCRTSHLHDLYRQHMTGNHLDVGTGTGYFIDRNPFPVENPRLALLDLNANCIEKSEKRLARFNPETILADVLKPIDYPGQKFDSISLTYLLHCLPRKSLQEKACVLDHLSALLNPGGVIFGANILSKGVVKGPICWICMRNNNRVGIFTNRGDSYSDMEAILKSRFERYEIQKRGVVALWAAWKSSASE